LSDCYRKAERIEKVISGVLENPIPTKNASRVVIKTKRLRDIRQEVDVVGLESTLFGFFFQKVVALFFPHSDMKIKNGP